MSASRSIALGLCRTGMAHLEFVRSAASSGCDSSDGKRRMRSTARRVLAVVGVLQAVFLVGCESYFIPEAPETVPRLVVDGAFSTDSTWSVSVTRLRLLGETRTEPAPGGYTVTDADVVVTPARGALTIPLRHVGAGRYLGPPDIRPEPGQSYRLVVAHPTLGMTSATGEAPVPPTFETSPAEFLGDRDNYEPTSTYRFRLRIRGAGQAASFVVAVSQARPGFVGEIDGSVRPRPVAFSSDDPDLRAYFFDVGPVQTYTSFYGGGAVLRAEIPEGEWRDIVITATATRFPESGRDLFVHVTAISEALRDHLRTRSLQEQYEGDPFAGVAPLSSNVEGGLGVFGGYTRRTQSVPLTRP